ncbi:MAG: hypothetical protein U5L09_13785 [Bacteroidales bacterium]|nr:hypothetical protein [Bacteroidales bacterium]
MDHKAEGNSLTFFDLTVCKSSRITDPAIKLRRIFERTLSLIEEYHPYQYGTWRGRFTVNV